MITYFIQIPIPTQLISFVMRKDILCYFCPTPSFIIANLVVEPVFVCLATCPFFYIRIEFLKYTKKYPLRSVENVYFVLFLFLLSRSISSEMSLSSSLNKPPKIESGFELLCCLILADVLWFFLIFSSEISDCLARVF